MLPGSTTCKATRRDGSRCMGPANGSNGNCWIHDPANQAKAAAARSAGGRARAKTVRAEKLMPAKLRPVLDTLLEALEKVEDGRLTPQQASAMASLAGGIIKVYTSGTLEERLQALESAQTPGTTEGRWAV